jgi:L-iditol 2-dehydrogenase
MKNQTAYLTHPEKIEISDSKMPFVSDDDVLVRMNYVAICGSDSYFFKDPTYGGAFDSSSILPIVLGHECSGIVESTGSNVKHLSPGDLVALEPGNGCGRCHYCMEGHYNLCREMNFMAAYPFKRGALSRYVSHPGAQAFKLLDDMTAIEGSLIEPLAVGMHAVNRSGAKLGMTAVVLGTGCIGLMTIASLKSIGVDNIIAVDLFSNRLQNASDIGAKHIINASEKDIKQSVMEHTSGEGAQLIFETAGNQKTASLSIDLAAPGGKIIMVGNVHGQTPFNFLEANNKEVDIISVFRYANIFNMAIQAVSNKRINVNKMVSRVFPFEETQQAFECTQSEKNTVIKVAIKI